MSGQDWHCSVCIEQRATSFCFCGGRETFLCEGCFVAHYQKNPFQVHIPAPISAYGPHKIEGYFERLQTRSMNIPRGREELLRNIGRVDECIAEVERAIETIIAAANEYKETKIQQLREEKVRLEQCINAAIAEVERTMHEDTPALPSQLAKDLRACKQDLSTFQYIAYKVEPQRVVSALRSMCIFSTTNKAHKDPYH